MPTIKELQSLIDFRFAGRWLSTDPLPIDLALANTSGKGPQKVGVDDDPFIGVLSEAYWTSSTVAAAPSQASAVDLNVGTTRGDISKEDDTVIVDNQEVSNLRAVWAVKGGPQYPTQRAQCNKQGWRNYPFNSRLQCIRFVNIR